MSKASERWLEQARAWLDEQMAEQRARDEAAWKVFRAGLIPNKD